MSDLLGKKPFLLYRAPVESVSGYGAHSRDLLRCLKDLDLFDIKIDSCAWGHTPLTALKDDNLFHLWIKNNIVRGQIKVPEIYIQVTVPNEFVRMGKVNIGVTAGIESTIAPKDWIDGCNRMDLVITTSTFSKKTLEFTSYNETDKNTNEVLKIYKVERPIEVLFEGVDTLTYKKEESNGKIKNLMDEIKSDFCFLFVGHWLNGDLGQDRKDVGMLVKSFCEAFADSEIKPSLILKTSGSNFSVKERERYRYKILEITSHFQSPPDIFLLFGEMEDEEMNSLYNHPKVKAMVSLTKGEGFGRPFLEFSMVGKPIITTNYSGHLDFLDKDKTVLIPGTLTHIHESAANNFLLKEGKWFTADYEQFKNVLKYFVKNYEKFLNKSEEQRLYNQSNFSIDSMRGKLADLIKRYIVIQKKEKIILPQLIDVD